MGLQHALGVDPWTALLHVALGAPADLAPTRAGHAAVRFLTGPRPGRLTAIHGLPQAGPDVPSVRVRRTVGDQITSPGDNSTRLGHLVVTGPDPADVEARADAILAAIRIEVE